MLKFLSLVDTPSLRVTQLSAWTGARAFFVRRFSVTSASPAEVQHHNDSAELEPEPEPKPYSAIPSPLKLPFLGTVWNLALPWNWGKSIHSFHKERAKKYGKIYREHIPFFGDFVFLLDPNDAQKFFRAQGKYPRRIPFDMWKDAREDLQMEFSLILLDGEDWHRQRVPMSKFTMLPQKVGEFHEGFNDITTDLLNNIRKLRDSTSLLPDIVPQLFRWSFENSSMFVLGRRLGCMEDPVPQECQKLIDVVQNFLESSQKIIMGPPSYKNSKAYKSMKESLAEIYSLALKMVEERAKEISEEDRQLAQAGESGEEEEGPIQVDLLTYLTHSGKMSLGEVAANAIDMLIGAIDTTSITLGWTLYFLARNAEVQERLRQEVLSVVGQEKVVTPAHVNNMPYLKHCIRETLRLCPPAMVSRALEEDHVFSGFHIPAGTLVSHNGMAMGQDPEIFPEPESYKPERWDRESKTSHPFAVVPFGFGPRMCVGRRIAELEVYIAVAHVVKSFQLSYPSGVDVHMQQKLLNMPDRPINITFADL